nr:prepilin peptidase [Chloroflexota bacterium]
MSAIPALLVGVLGLFASGVIWTVAEAQASSRAWWSGPACTSCGAAKSRLGWIPLVGGMATRRCPACKYGIEPIKRLVFEVITAAYFGLAALRLGASRDLVETLIFAVPLLIVLLVDWWTRLIHTNVILVGLLLGVGFALLDGPWRLLSSLGAALGAVLVFACFFALAALIYRNLRVVPFGLGDVYLAAMIGAMTRLPAVVSALF